MYWGSGKDLGPDGVWVQEGVGLRDGVGRDSVQERWSGLGEFYGESKPLGNTELRNR